MKPGITCGNCGASIRYADKFCSSCGRPVDWENEGGSGGGRDAAGLGETVVCKSCGSVNQSGAEFCESCGANLGNPKSAGGAREDSRRPAKKKAAVDLPAIPPWRIVAGFAVVLAGGIAVVELRKPSPVVETPAPPLESQSQPTANMDALKQAQEMESQVAANPNDLNGVLQLANFLNDNRFFDKAVVYYKKYLAKKPEDPNARVDMAICYKELGDLDRAEREMKQALVYDPNHLYAHYNLGIVNLLEGKVAESADWFRKTVALSPNSDIGRRAQQLLAQHNQRDLQTN
ncbi:MAG TPA: tetratricopeptide repeat protein [Bacteroidota bacterium]|nr:tetratricopeptide repeat protein [Bacteroidota bacterium]